ncbi:PREDICTED: ribonuclease 3-like protein 1 isoform X1 [Camelina sativa]|uniref:Ribonuclease 3-like protein 1 isoform X1 n=1 Tax=Camelina sativa TaxID=90675 RepID=A0ABM0SXT5_CAMSA|nr:PREDICTED: ribonuclease 3-like protein 1 isoform X1 [Camelina sativa]
MEDRVTKQRIGKINPSRRRSFISLKDIPPLDPSSIPAPSSSLKPRARMMVQDDNAGMQSFDQKSELKKLIDVNEEEVKEEKNAFSSFSNIQIDPNSTRRSLISITQEKNLLLPKPEAEDTKPKSKDESKRGSAKSVLHEICASKRWRPPVYECCKVDGPCHMRLFTYKVVVEIRDSSGNTVLECFGDPKRNKKAAAEHAAEGALWYLHHASQNQTKPDQ